MVLADYGLFVDCTLCMVWDRKRWIGMKGITVFLGGVRGRFPWFCIGVFMRIRGLHQIPHSCSFSRAIYPLLTIQNTTR